MTFAVLGVHVPLLMVHWYTYVPYNVAVAVEVPDVGALKVVVPGPDTWLHDPDPIAGVLPPNDPLTRTPQ